jgi:sugar O-acyltransferase (sialic acid O-acetyltransferase NeuD family)
MSLDKLAIIGAGGFGREVLDVVNAINAVRQTFEVVAFIVDRRYGAPGELVNDVEVAGDLGWLAERHGDVRAVCAVGAPEVRRRMTEEAAAAGIRFATLIHPQAVLTRWISVGEGAVITAGCILTNQITVGRHVHVNLACTVGHDAVLEDYATLAPGVHVSGHVVVEEGAYVGTGANVVERLRIGRWSVVGAGSTVLANVPANTTAVGIPARVIKTRDDGWHLL